MPLPFPLAQAPSFNFVDRIDGDILGAIVLVTSILFFISVTVVATRLIRAHERSTAARMHRELIDHLLAQGLAPHEIHALVHGPGPKRKSRSGMFRNSDLTSMPPVSVPVPPRKPVHQAT